MSAEGTRSNSESSSETPVSPRFNSVKLEHAGCPLGCSGEDRLILVGRDRLFNLPGEYSLVRCNRCGLMRTSPRPTPESMGFYYPSDYGPYLGTRVSETRPEPRVKSLLRPLVQRMFDDRSKKIPTLKPKRMLEIGCASGGFLKEMAQHGWEVEGIEFAEAPASSARALGFKVQSGALEHANPPDQPADLIVGWMVLEHLHDPVQCLKKLKAWSSPDATLVLSVPNANSLEFRVFKSRWYALQLPAHLTHFTPKTLGNVLRAGGWRIEKVFYQRSLANLMMSSAYVAEDRGWFRARTFLEGLAWRGGVVYYSLFPLAWLLSKFAQTGRMTVWARHDAAKHEARSESAP